MDNIIPLEQINNSRISALDFGIDIDSLQINSLLIPLLILVIIGLAVLVA